jgi:hypothetical protein
VSRDKERGWKKRNLVDFLSILLVVTFSYYKQVISIDHLKIGGNYMKTKIFNVTVLSCVLLLSLAVCIGVPNAKAATDEQIEQAIKDGLAWLANEQNIQGGNLGDPARTALAVLKFEDYAREIGKTPFDDDYMYKDNVVNGLNYIFSQASIMDINNQPAGNPDTNGNGTGVNWSNSTYYTSIVMMAIAGSETPDRLVSGGACNGWTYKDVLQDAADYMAYGQSDTQCVDRGGWSYSARNNSCGNDNSNAGYAVLGLGYAQVDPFNCTIPAWVMDELSLYCDYIQNDVDGDTHDGGSGYSHPNDWVNVLKTGNLLYEMALTGDTEETQRVKDALDYLERHWGDNADPGWRPNHYQAMYTCMKGLEAMGIFTFGDPEIDWYADFSDAIVSQQNADGSWPICPCYCWDSSCHNCDSIICTEWALLTLERSVPPLIRPVVGDIPDQCVLAGGSFAAISLDEYVKDGDNADDEIVWTTSGEVDITVDIDSDRVATITYPDGWTGSETITFTATDPDDQSDSGEATFTVDPVPVVDDIPDQTAPFGTFDLDDFLSGIDPSDVTWSYSGNSCLEVSIDADSVVTITNPGGCTDPETITFTATAIACGNEVSDSDEATFIPNQPPDCSDAYPSIQEIWPPNHKYVDIEIMGVTDPDGDPVTITITGITQDEPVDAVGNGDGKTSPDGTGVGTGTACVRAEREGTGNGRVYAISFTATDPAGAECSGSVTICVPHDQGPDHECIDDGQDYDSTTEE